VRKQRIWIITRRSN